MSDDYLQNSHWDDAISSNPDNFTSSNPFADNDNTVANELSTTLANTDIIGEQNDNIDEIHSINNDEDEVQKENSKDDLDKQEINDKSDNEESEESKPDEHAELLSNLTKDADKPFISDSFQSPQKGDSLFNDKPSKSIDIQIEEEEKNNDDDITTKTAATLSPTKLRRTNVYKAPRFRRNQIKPANLSESVDILSQTQSNNQNHDNDENNNQNDNDPLGPLGQSIKDTSEPTNQAEELLKQLDEPLFKINRTQLTPIKDLPQITRKPEEPSKPKIKLDISVGDPIKVGDITGSHIVYSVRTKTDSDLFKAQEIIVSRRYTDFRWLYRQLQTANPGRIIPPPPDKQAVGRFNEDFIENRRLALEKMLVKISDNINLQTDQDFIMFLQSERFTSEARERQKALVTNSIFSEHESDSSIENTSNSNNGGFLSSLGGAFSFQPKIVEPEDYFKDKKLYFESLDYQLKTFFKNLDIIINQRTDLATVTEEFSNIIMTLADLEVSKTTTQLFQDFSNIQLKIKDLLNRLSLQDMLTLGSTLDEYQRIISSIKTIFQQRDKVLLQLSNSDSELKKKKSTFEKYNKYNKSQTEKLDILQNELNTIEKKHSTIEERFENISKTIKEELDIFELEKIQDFRNTIEIYLESTIESQKEIVELWETFYDTNFPQNENV
ncbi:hypothetical protein WICMUC_004641 [Wickerhamomyces mucosus]|uniref:PX domain-containing protein n=1 Tax=Wickerhamomyces mucosus TaxID=1378264 RepID=A0A9P8PG38_9ASCO|nr:hypothetical protein WICMUC_004641 [Wickerhamomyces mucosus]